jgi:hypothetical protein
MTITAADEIITAASIPVAQLPIAPTPWNYQAESFQPGNSALQNSQFEHTGHTIYNQRGILWQLQKDKMKGITTKAKVNIISMVS